MNRPVWSIAVSISHWCELKQFQGRSRFRKFVLFLHETLFKVDDCYSFEGRGGRGGGGGGGLNRSNLFCVPSDNGSTEKEKNPEGADPPKPTHLSEGDSCKRANWKSQKLSNFFRKWQKIYQAYAVPISKFYLGSNSIMRRLIWVYTVCSGLSVRMLNVNTVYADIFFRFCKRTARSLIRLRSDVKADLDLFPGFKPHFRMALQLSFFYSHDKGLEVRILRY